MQRRAAAVILVLLLSQPLTGASLVLSPADQAAEPDCTVYVRAAGLSDAAGLNLVISWDPARLACTGAFFDRNRLPGFTGVLETIDNSSGRLEVVLLRLGPGGLSGDADSLLAVRFTAIADGAAEVSVAGWDAGPEPVLVNAANQAVVVGGGSAAVNATQPPAVTAVKLHQNYPNPFNPGTTIRFDVPAPAPVWLRIYDPAGRLVRALIAGEWFGTGSWERQWDGRSNAGTLVPSGIYFCVLETGGKTESHKLVVLR